MLLRSGPAGTRYADRSVEVQCIITPWFVDCLHELLHIITTLDQPHQILVVGIVFADDVNEGVRNLITNKRHLEVDVHVRESLRKTLDPIVLQELSHCAIVHTVTELTVPKENDRAQTSSIVFLGDGVDGGL